MHKYFIEYRSPNYHYHSSPITVQNLGKPHFNITLSNQKALVIQYIHPLPLLNDLEEFE